MFLWLREGKEVPSDWFSTFFLLHCWPASSVPEVSGILRCRLRLRTVSRYCGVAWAGDEGGQKSSIDVLGSGSLAREPVCHWSGEVSVGSRSGVILVRFIYRGCDRVLVQSRAFIERVRALGADPKQILYFPTVRKSCTGRFFEDLSRAQERFRLASA